MRPASIVRDVALFGFPVGDAIAAPRLHHQWLPDRIDEEPGAIAPADRALLLKRGYHTDEQSRPARFKLSPLRPDA